MGYIKNMNKICTDINQSQKLIELGIDVKTADMFWDTLFAKKPEAQVNNHHYIDEYDDEHRVPAWSLSALLGLMPKIHEYETDAGCQPILCKGWDNFQWHVVYRSSIHITEWYDDPLDAAFEMIIWLKENGKI